MIATVPDVTSVNGVYLHTCRARCSRARFNEDDKFHILCAIYLKLNERTNTTFTTALAQTCWAMKAKKGSLIIT